jgi:alpha-D-xyloside xylohydrolase
MYGQVQIDGMWIDMNEVSNFCNHDGLGQVCENLNPDTCPDPVTPTSECCLTCRTVDTENQYDFPPYPIGHYYGHLSARSMSMSAVHYDDVTAYDAHNLYGLTEHIATTNAMIEATGKRPFVLSRSSFVSTGKHGAKWTGDNAATWQDLKASIVGIMDFNMFGVPMIGADICGELSDDVFWDYHSCNNLVGHMMNTTEELCARWIEVGAYYPFARDHSTKKVPSHELYLWPSVTEAAKKALKLRYMLLPYLYTLFADAHAHGSPVVKSLWMNYPEDVKCEDIDGQFMLGDNIIISAVLEPMMEHVQAYFPEGVWYPISAGRIIYDSLDDVTEKIIFSTSGGREVLLNTPLTDTNVHVRGGSILPLQEAGSTTAVSRQTPFTLLISLSHDVRNVSDTVRNVYTADGYLFWDDGEQLTYDANGYLQIQYRSHVSSFSRSGSITNTFMSNSYAGADSLYIDTIVVNGVRGSSLDCDGNNLDTTLVRAGIVSNHIKGSCQRIKGTQYEQMVFSRLAIPLREEFQLSWGPKEQ